MNQTELKEYLDQKVEQYNTPAFIEADPISIPHSFTKKQDIEIAGFFAALFAWGNRTIIINKSKDLLGRMDNAPYDYVQHATDKDFKSILGFKHRTFQDGDILFLLTFLQQHYATAHSLESAFIAPRATSQMERLKQFYKYVFSLPHLKRAEKHISTPSKQSACKRINMFLRWMVRKDDAGVDFGIWNSIPMKDLIIPLDLHVSRVAQKLKLLEKDKANWSQAVALTNKLCKLDPSDPVKYDFALFALGVIEKY